MKFSSSFVLSGLLSLALANPLEHAHHQHKRDVVTVVVTQVVTQAVGANNAAISTTSAEVVQVSNVAGSSTGTTTTLSQTVATSSAKSVATTSVEAVASVSTGSTSTSSTSTSTSTSTSSSSDTISFAAGGKGITYSPYTSSGACKDAATVASDIAKLTQFDVIRIYDTDCSGVENVLAAKTSSQQIFLGIYYLANIESSVSIISDAIANVDGGWDNVYTVSVGNELVNSGEATTDQISSAISEARSYLTSAGYTGTVVSVDTLVAVQNNPVLCDYSDFVAVNSHPYWDGSVEPADAGTWLETQISNIKSVCGGEKSVLICETGWPTQGDSYGVAVPSIANQETAVEAIVSAVGDQVLLFTTYNDLWKSAGSYGVEQYWGLIQST